MEAFKALPSRTTVYFGGRDEAIQCMRAWAEQGRTLIVASEGTLRRQGLNDFAEGVCSQDGMLYAQVPANPDIGAVAQALRAVEGFTFERVIAIGGGSAIDLAKAICALRFVVRDASYVETESAIVEKRCLRSIETAPILAVPTTAGTGSEVTQWATIWDTREKKKYSLDMPSLCPQEAVIAPEFTCTMDEELTVSTGLDALSHAMEAYWAVARNPVSQAIALDAARRIFKALPGAAQNPRDVGLRGEMCVASLLAGEAFAMTRTTACHSISYPLTLLFGVPHGFAAAALLPEVAQRNGRAVPEVENLLAVFGGLCGFQEWMGRAMRSVGFSLGRYGIGREQLSAIAERAFTLGRMDNNPVALTRQDVVEMLEKIL